MINCKVCNMFNVNDIRKDFPILNREIYGKPLVYLDNAATSQKPQSVIDCVNNLHSNLNANIHRGIHFLAEQTTEKYENAREIVRDFINADSTREIIFTSGATASINLVAHSFAKKYFTTGDNLVISVMEHHSNIVPWQLVAQQYGVEIRILPIDDDGRLCVEKLPELLDNHTKIVAITQTSNVTGTNTPLKEIIEMAHSLSIPVMVDGCQGIVHNGVDVKELDADFYAFSGHKIFAPTGIGILYGKEKFLDALPPFLGGGDMIATVSLTKGTTWADLPLKFEAGTSNYIGAIALGEALNYVSGLDTIAAEKHQQALLSRFEAGIATISGLKIYGRTIGKTSICSFTFDGIHPMDMAQIIDKLGVAIRSGTHCAEPLMERFGVTSMCRASFSIYNTLSEVDIALAAVERAVSMLR